ncbi:MAG: hypothetical protein HY320_05210 [Armatimonadetes bacterium]|nr:hypothetical protein [Armatimonadota bacterium]
MLAVGLIVHAAISIFWGVVYNIGLGWRLGMNATWQALAGMGFGLAIWLVDFYILAPLFWPWFKDANPIAQFIIHVFFYGLPLGLALAAFWVRQPVACRRAVAA